MRHHAVVPVLALTVQRFARMSLAVFALLAVGFTVAPASAQQWGPNGAPICTASNDQTGVKVVDDHENGMYVLWADKRSGSWALYLKRVGPDGSTAPGWSVNEVQISADVRTPTNEHTDYDMVLDHQWNPIIVWSKQSNLYAQRVDRLNGNLIWQTGAIVTLTGDDIAPSIAWMPTSGRLMVAFESSGHIFSQQVDNYGYPYGAPVQVSSQLAHDPVICGSSDPIVAFRVEVAGSTHCKYFTQKLPSGYAGPPIWQQEVPVGVAGSNQNESGMSMVSDGNGGAYCAWTVTTDPVNNVSASEVYCARVNAGTTAGSVPWRPRNGTSTSARDHRVVAGGTGAIFVWSDLGSSSITAATRDFNGSQYWINLVAVAPSPSGLKVFSDGSEGFIATWSDARNGSSNKDIFAQRMSGSGDGRWTANNGNGVPLTFATNDQDLPGVTTDGSHGALVAWQDKRSGNWDIYGQRVTSAGLNRAPTVTAPATQAGAEGAALSFTVSAADPDGDAISSLTSSSSPATMGSTFTANAAKTSGTFAWTPVAGSAGTYTVTFTASNSLSGSAATTITVGAAPITITAPVGGEHWNAGSTQTVTWTGSGNVDVLASPDAGLTWVPLTQGVQGGSVSVTVPQWNSTQVIIKVARSSPASSSQSGLITVLQPASMTWSIQETSLEDAYVGQSLAMALGAGDSPNILFSSVTGNGRPLFAKPIAGWWYPENPLNQNSGVANASIAVDANGNPHMSYIEVGNFRLAYLKKVDGVWSYEQVKPTWETLIYYNSLRLTPQGVPHIARVDSQGRLVISWKDGNNWVHPLVPGAISVTYPSLAMNSQGEPRVTYAETNGRLRYVERTGASTWTMSGILGNASYSSLVVDGQGNPKVAWYDPGTKNLMYRERINNSWSTPVTVDFIGTTGQFPSLALDAAGLPRIAYYGNGVLLYSWCDANGNWSTTLVDGSGNAGVSPSLALNSQGNPRIAYLDAASRRPRYAVSPADNVRPNEVQLSVTWGSTTAVVLWNAPGDDNTNGQAVEYDLRYAMNGIGDSDFLTATRLPTPPPGPAGQQQAASVSGLNCGQAYAFALKTRDESCNWSGSNIVTGAGNCGGGIEVDYSSQKDGHASAPATLQFSRSTPNPSRGEVRFRVGVPVAQRGAREELLLFDVAGRLVRALVSDAAQPGWRDHVWDLRTNSGYRARTGVYFVRYRLGQETRRQTIVLTK
jgi:hypothetical protein